MLEYLSEPFANGPIITPRHVFVRLVVAVLCGLAVSWIYRRTRRDGPAAPTFPATLVLLAVLIAMVTQVIGDNIARAFSLVGALSIVRFRTAVRDTQDTAFVIFAVVVGMAVGARDLWLAALGLGVVGAAAFALAHFPIGTAPVSYLLTVRLPAAADLESTCGPVLTQHVGRRHFQGVSLAKTGESADHTQEIILRLGSNPGALLQALRTTPGVQGIECRRRATERE